MAAKENLDELYKRFLRNECNPAEISRLSELFDAADYQVLQEMVRQQLDDPSATIPFRSSNQYRYDRIFRNLKEHTKPSRPVRSLWANISAAAGLILLVASGGYFWYQKVSPKPVLALHQVHKDVKPGGNRAYLTLSDGREINLSGMKSGRIGSDGGNDILQAVNGEISYVDGQAVTEQGPAALNTLRTPNGGHYRVILPDGTKVWLNAASQLRYPANFEGLQQRKIDLTGEAYFEVAKDPHHPFVVQTDDQQIRVLGTHFNVNAYHDNGGSKTTLLEGSIHARGKQAEVTLVPGQQVSTVAKGRLKVDPADQEIAVAWKNDQFMFESEPISILMKTLARWYDVEVVYGKDVPDIRFNGAVSRFENISEVLKILESTGKIHFQIDGRKVRVIKQ
ncbi:FecR family protein [Pedobacter hartonius]|uniref:FecR family protein n=1 Tax=Pedobacter hartonius TaxID=425514 RepID=A0A1H4H9E4_9SPHI|nr:FecR family protein [Pedobacter hartonius]SEB17698.1 FecR family protein [Pedobacter hartonius]